MGIARDKRWGLGTLAVACVALCGWVAPAGAHLAYVADADEDKVTVINTATNSTVGGTIAVGDYPYAIAITPDGTRAYVANQDGGVVSVINTANRAITASVTVGSFPSAVAVTPGGSKALVANLGGDSVSIISTASNTAIATANVGDQPQAIAIAPDGATAYVPNFGDDTVSVIDLGTNLVTDTIDVGDKPVAIAITPDGGKVYVVESGDDTVAVIATATNAVVDSIAVGELPVAVAITPNGARAYVANLLDDTVSAINTAGGGLVGGPIAVGDNPSGIAITSDGARAYVTNAADGSVSVLNTATNAAVGSPIAVGQFPVGTAITPNQTPVARLTTRRTAYRGHPHRLNASASTDDDGVESYRFKFGDGEQSTSASATRDHTYASLGTYEATVVADDGDGCPDTPLFAGLASPFTGQTAYCNGPSQAESASVEINVIELPILHLRLRIKRPQKSFKKIRVRATCRGAACRARALGRLRIQGPGRNEGIKLKRKWRRIGADRTRVMALRIRKGARDPIREALERGADVRAKVRVKAFGPGGQQPSRIRRTRIDP